jgi:hypothetical protein
MQPPLEEIEIRGTVLEPPLADQSLPNLIRRLNFVQSLDGVGGARMTWRQTSEGEELLALPPPGYADGAAVGRHRCDAALGITGSGPIKHAQVDGWQTLANKSVGQPIDLAPCLLAISPSKFQNISGGRAAPVK